jgi:hypothetical protein
LWRLGKAKSLGQTGMQTKLLRLAALVLCRKQKRSCPRIELL